ncbi:MAG: endonuclease/exonuclease/phosphatase family protein [Burkholderiales bacterium]|nr:endonuclease/exonuclease/phosphatase family protein [Burkholderiales bacterium]
MLRQRIGAAQIPPSKIDETLNIATWNIRELGKKRRADVAIHYVAEIIGQFDLVSVVELRDDLTDLGRILKILGPYWRAVYSDMIPDAGGNRERLGFVYDKRAVAFTGLAAAANPPRRKVGTEYVPEFTWWRMPYMASFASGNFDFVVITAHVRWGASAAERETELASLAEWIDLKRRQRTVEDKDLIVMGDFNIPSRRSSLFRTITAKQLELPRALAALEFGTDLAKGKRYDQIFHYPIYPENFTNAGACSTSTPATTGRSSPICRRRSSPTRSRTTCRSGCSSTPTSTARCSTRSSAAGSAHAGIGLRAASASQPRTMR